ncbi:MAG: MFS transporter [Methanobacteriaceae archaeon]|nr:MFS transporter [Methanobacteriaceae archaeon]
MQKDKEDLKRKIGFIGASITMILIYAASSSPIPLYAMYQSMFGIIKNILSMSAVFYFIGTVISLLMFGRLSDYIGRHKTILITIILAILGCFNFIIINNATIFLIGRLLQGLSCGLASSCVAAYIVDTASDDKSSLGAIVTSSATMIGLSIGVFGGSALVELNPNLISTIFVIWILTFIICALLIFSGKETVKPKKGAFKSMKPQIKVPTNIKRFIPIAAAIFIGTWAVGGFYQAFSATMSIEQFGVSNKLLGAAIFASLMAPQIVGSSLVDKFKSFNGERVGMVGFAISMVLIIVSLKYSLVVPFLIFNIISAMFIGLSFTSIMNAMLERTSQTDRAGVLSTIYLISYGGTAIVNLVVGQIANNIPLLTIAIGYCCFVIITCVITLIGTFKISYEDSEKI